MPPYTKEQIVEEYNFSASFTDEHKKVKWGSNASMFNRYWRSINELPFSDLTEWLDIGCGTGAFQAIVKQEYPHIKGLGIDLNRRLIAYALQRNLSGIRFSVGDFMKLSEGSYDIVTSIGVIQKANFTLSQFFNHASNLVRKSGHLLVDTKHSGWDMFRNQELVPEPIHDWFSVEELRDALYNTKFEEIFLSGFDPTENKIVKPRESHTILMIVRKT